MNSKRRPRRRDSSKHNSISPPASPKVVLLRPTHQQSASASLDSTGSVAVTIAARPTSPNSSSQKSSSLNHFSIQGRDTLRERNVSPSHRILKAVTEDFPHATTGNSVVELIDGHDWSFCEQAVSEYMLGDSVNSGYNVITVIGKQSSGKSSLLNMIAGRDVFKTHSRKSNRTADILQHVTSGVDLFITRERQFLLDPQAVLSASLLDDYINNSIPQSTLANDVTEPENFHYVMSLQLLSFLFTICDHMVVASDWEIDIHLVKLIATALMITDGSNQANITWYIKKEIDPVELKGISETLELLLGRGIVTVINGKEKDLIRTVVKKRRRESPEQGVKGLPSSEKSWLVSAARYWESSVKKSTLFTDYARFMP
ncbi:Protein SMG9 [Halotydeus destructor]|nr:Protein SMG9 [Halotydeus destructor]